MPRSNPIKAAFNSGEFSPRMIGRVDYAKYPNGCATLCNFIPLVQGGITRRPGTKYAVELKDSSAKSRLMRFEFSSEQAYAIEVGNLYFRWMKNQGQITAANITASITNGTFTDNITNWTDRSAGTGSIAHDVANGRLSLVPGGATSADIGWAEQQVTNALALDHTLQFQVIGAPGDKIELRVGTASVGIQIVDDIEFNVGYHEYTFTATAADFYLQFRNLGVNVNKTVQIDNVALIDNAAQELKTPYTTAQLFDIKTAQSADVMYLTHPSQPVYKLTRSSHTSWSLIEVAWQDGPYLDYNVTTTTFTSAAATGAGVIVTASSVAGINDNTGFQSTDVGRLIRIDDESAEPGWAIITSVTDTTHVVVDIKRTVVISAETKWSLGAFSGTTGYPAACGFSEQRLVLARTTTQPQTFYISQSAIIEDMRPDSWDSITNALSPEDDDALVYTFAANTVNTIQWVSAGKQLAIGTLGGVWIAESNGATLTPTDIQCRPHVSSGSADISPERIDDVVIYVHRATRKINEFSYNFESDGYRAPDMTILSDHVTKSGVVEIAYAEEPNSIVWCVRTDGVLASLIYRRQEDVVGWARHKIGGTFNTGIAMVESIIAIPGNTATSSDDRDEVWMIVKRTIDGVTKRYIEFIEANFEGPIRHDYSTDALHTAAIIEAQKDAFYVDSGLTLDNPKTITAVTKADPCVVTATAHGLSDGDEVEITDVLGMTELNGNSYLAANIAPNTLELVSTIGAVIMTGATKADPCVITATSHGFSNGDLIGFFDVVGMTELNGNIYKVASVTADTLALQTVAGVDIDSTAYTTYTAGGKIYHAVDSADFTIYSSDGKVREKVTSITGLDHLEGETIKIFADGAVHPDKTVSSGAITLDYKAARVHAGLGYTHTFKSLKLNSGAAAGTAVNKIKRVNKIGMVLLDAATTKIGPKDSSLVDITFREVGDSMDIAVPVFTGEKKVDFDSDYETDQRIIFQSDAPAPFTLLALTPEMKTSDGA